MTRLVVGVDESCQREALETVLQCLEDGRPATIDRRAMADQNHLVEISWTRTDSPKRQACLSVKTWVDRPFDGLADDEILSRCLGVMRRSLGDDLDMAEITTWWNDLRAVAVHAALGHEALGDVPPSRTGNCQARAPSPWAPGRALRTRARNDLEEIVTLDEVGLLDLIPGLASLVIIRETEITRKGVCRVTLGGLQGNMSHRDVPMTELLRLAGRFGEYRPPA